MQHLVRQDKKQDQENRFRLFQKSWMRPVTMLLAMAAFAGGVRLGTQPAQSMNDKRVFPTVSDRPLDANLAMHGQQAKEKILEQLNLERKRQMSADSALLLKLAADLKAEVDRTDKDMLSITVIRQANEIEKLAHNVREKMKASVTN
jgi:hypothetical protein